MEIQPSKNHQVNCDSPVVFSACGADPVEEAVDCGSSLEEIKGCRRTISRYLCHAVESNIHLYCQYINEIDKDIEIDMALSYW